MLSGRPPTAPLRGKLMLWASSHERASATRSRRQNRGTVRGRTTVPGRPQGWRRRKKATHATAKDTVPRVRLGCEHCSPREGSKLPPQKRSRGQLHKESGHEHPLTQAWIKRMGPRLSKSLPAKSARSSASEKSCRSRHSSPKTLGRYPVWRVTPRGLKPRREHGSRAAELTTHPVWPSRPMRPSLETHMTMLLFSSTYNHV